MIPRKTFIVDLYRIHIPPNGREVGNIDSKVPGWEGICLVLGYVSPYHWLGEANIQPLQSHPEIFDSKKIRSPLNQPATSSLVCFPAGVGLHHVFSRDDEDGTKHDG